MRVYNKAVYMPKFEFPKRNVPLTYSHHSLDKADILSITELPATVNYQDVDIVEVYTDKGRIVKTVVRTYLDADNDLVLVLRYARGAHHVVTMWVNHKFDTHSTLNVSKFVRKP